MHFQSNIWQTTIFWQAFFFFGTGAQWKQEIISRKGFTYNYMTKQWRYVNVRFYQTPGLHVVFVVLFAC